MEKFPQTIKDLVNGIPFKKYMEKQNFPHPIKGQLKLFLSEVMFFNYIKFKDLVKESNKKILIIYAGSSPGTHINLIIDLFKDDKVFWYLIDPRPTLVKPIQNRIIIDTEFATGSWAKNIKKKFPKTLYDIIFISDIRSSEEGKEISSANLLEDYKLQEELLEALDPIKSSLKWRCPFPDDWIEDFQMYEGEEFLQAFSGTMSAELRLFLNTSIKNVNKKTITKKEAMEYESKLCYYNFVLRKKQNILFNHKYPYLDFFRFHYYLNILDSIIINNPLEEHNNMDPEEKRFLWESYILKRMKLTKFFDL